jgi:hypothetical protein
MDKLIKLFAVIFVCTQFLPKVSNAQSGYSQTPMATYCGTGCPGLTVSHVKRTDLGAQNSTVFEITNNLPGQVKGYQTQYHRKALLSIVIIETT